MEFFKEKNGKFVAESISGNPRANSAVRMGVFLIAVGAFAFYFFMSPSKESFQDKTPLLIAMGAVVFTNVIVLLLRSAGHGSGIIVDQMNGTLSYRKPGGNRHKVPLDSLGSIIITEIPMRASVLSLEKSSGGRHVIMYSGDTMKMRMMAGELSTLTSLTVKEETRSQNGVNG